MMGLKANIPPGPEEEERRKVPPPPMRGDVRQLFRTKITEAAVRRQNANAEEKKTVKTRTEFPETWLWQTIKIK